jgi:hypothetical protein
MNFSAAHAVEGAWELALKPRMENRIISSSTAFLKHPKATEWLHRRFGVNKEGPEECNAMGRQ